MKKHKGSEYYDDIYKTSEVYQAFYKDSRYYILWTQIIQLLKQFPKPKILEIGCGTGQLAHYLYDEGYRNYNGFDFSPEAIAIARKTVPQSFAVANAFEKDSYNIDYNVVIAAEFLEHVDDDMAVLDNIREGTAIILTLPTFDDPAHVRFFKTRRQLHNRYYTRIDDMKIIPISQWYVCVGIVEYFKLKLVNRLLKTRSQIGLSLLIRKLGFLRRRLFKR